VDPINNVLGDKTLLERRCRARHASVAYVICVAPPEVEPRGGCPASSLCVHDVTASYAANPSCTRRKRLKRREDLEWWTSVQAQFGPSRAVRAALPPATTPTIPGSVAECPALTVLPTSRSGFKGHHTYALKSLLSDKQVVQSGAHPVGLFAGSLIYYRRDVLELRSAQEWCRLGRVVRTGEVPRRGSQGALGTSQSDTVELFAEDQTDQVVAPVLTLVNGEIPRNKHGNIAIWGGDPRFVPVGASHVRHRLAAAAAGAGRGLCRGRDRFPRADGVQHVFGRSPASSRARTGGCSGGGESGQSSGGWRAGDGGG